MDSERRSEARFQAAENLSFIVPVFESREIKYMDGSGVIANKSASGLCLTTTTPLEPGHVLRTITFLPYVALVKWVAKENPNHYRAGLAKK